MIIGRIFTAPVPSIGSTSIEKTAFVSIGGLLAGRVSRAGRKKRSEDETRREERRVSHTARYGAASK
jgi:hypothetical protein